MQNKTPVFPGWQRYFGGRLRTVQSCPDDYAGQWESIFGELFDAGWFEPYEVRKRLYTRRTTFWLTLGQIYGDGIEAQGSFRDAVGSLTASLQRNGKVACSASTSAFSQAKQRMTPRLWADAFVRSSECVERFGAAPAGWEGRSIKLVDGTGVLAADTPDNQRIWPQHSSCAVGCGFPQVFLTALVSLGSGAVTDFAITNQHIGESTVTYAELWPNLRSGEIVVGDRNFSSYHLLASLHQRGVDFLVRVRDRERRSWTKEPISKDQWKVRVRRTQCRNPIYRDDWSDFPRELELKLVRIPGYNRDGLAEDIWLLTSLPDSNERLGALYRARWRIEIGYRDLKRTMGMFRLRALSSEGVEKEIHAFLVGYNLLRYLHVKAAQSYSVDPQRLSVKGTIDAMRHFRSLAISQPFWSRRARAWLDALLRFIAQIPNPQRPGRWAPRKRKFRDRGAGWLTQPRHVLRNRYLANVPVP